MKASKNKIVAATFLLVVASSVLGLGIFLPHTMLTSQSNVKQFGQIVVRNGMVDCNSVIAQNNGSIDFYYIPIGIQIYSSTKTQGIGMYAHDIFGIIECFKANHPDLEIQSIQIEKTHQGHYLYFIDGIWIYCTKKQVPKTK